MLFSQVHKLLPQKKYSTAEEWEYFEDGWLQRSRSACVCMTCQHFDYLCDRYCRTLLTCKVRQRLIPHGEHLNSRCPLWIKRLEESVSCSPEAA